MESFLKKVIPIIIGLSWGEQEKIKLLLQFPFTEKRSFPKAEKPPLQKWSFHENLKMNGFKNARGQG